MASNTLSRKIRIGVFAFLVIVVLNFSISFLINLGSGTSFRENLTTFCQRFGVRNSTLCKEKRTAYLKLDYEYWLELYGWPVVLVKSTPAIYGTTDLVPKTEVIPLNLILNIVWMVAASIGVAHFLMRKSAIEKRSPQ